MSNEAESARELVVLVHGIWLNGLEWLPLCRRLRRRGFDCRIFHYPSVRRPPAANAGRLAAFIGTQTAARVHLVAHSLGGIVVMHLLGGNRWRLPGRCVFLGTPAGGSCAARRLSRWPFLRPLLGRSVQRGLLGGAPAWQGTSPLGIIAGTLPVGAGRLLGPLPRPNDGTVAVAETRIPGAADPRVVPATHLGLLWSRTSAVLVERFLRTGRFDE
jgi:pimeloyl-ACP methyl ester carboxylesterase